MGKSTTSRRSRKASRRRPAQAKPESFSEPVRAVIALINAELHRAWDWTGHDLNINAAMRARVSARNKELIEVRDLLKFHLLGR